jgi:hypothetical protein
MTLFSEGGDIPDLNESIETNHVERGGRVSKRAISTDCYDCAEEVIVYDPVNKGK